MSSAYIIKFKDLTESAQEKLLESAIFELECDIGVEAINQEAEDNSIDYDEYVKQLAMDKLKDFDYTFKV